MSPGTGEAARADVLVVGVTGGMGAGKSTVTGLLAARGAVVVNCDALGREVLEPDGAAHQAVLEHFGPSIADAAGRIDRAALAARVFGDPGALAALNRITHPAIDARIADRIHQAGPDDIVVLDMAVLVESRLGAGQYDVVIVVEAPLELRLTRLAERGVPTSDARARIAAQATDEQRRAVADAVVVNDADLTTLQARVDRLWHQLLAWRDTAPAR